MHASLFHILKSMQYRYSYFMKSWAFVCTCVCVATCIYMYMYNVVLSPNVVIVML